MSEQIVTAHLEGLARTVRETRALAGSVARVAARVEETLRAGGTLYFCGNGGSAADAQHLAAEYVVRFSRERAGLAAMALTVDTSVLTAGGNDYGFERVFARQIEALGRRGDLLILHSTSGNSPNLLAAARAARDRGVATVAFLARDGGALRDRVDEAVIVPTEVTAHAQELHLALGHAVCEIVDRAFAGEPVAAGAARLEEARRREKAQTLLYRRLAALAEVEGREDEAERLNALHADEQHHLSRITARLLEDGLRPADLRDVAAPPAVLDGWEAEARRREEGEIAFYRGLLEGGGWPSPTEAVLREILAAEEHHAKELGGKWMSARPPAHGPGTEEDR